MVNECLSFSFTSTLIEIVLPAFEYVHLTSFRWHRQYKLYMNTMDQSIDKKRERHSIALKSKIINQ